MRRSLGGLAVWAAALLAGSCVLPPIDPTPGTVPALMRVQPGLYSGGQPRGDAAFAELRRLGVRTVISVDGAEPDVAAARRHGLRYVHIPIGYDGIGGPRRLALERAARELERPLFIHCHHGKHRAPAAAALVCRIDGTVDRDGARDILQRGGTSRDYTGLWQAVERFEPVAPGTPLPPLVEAVRAESLAAAMAGIDRINDRLKAARAAGWSTPAAQPDVSPTHQALLLREGFRESVRLLKPGADPVLRSGLRDAEDLARRLEVALRVGDRAAADAAWGAAARSCRQCHRRHRD